MDTLSRFILIQRGLTWHWRSHLGVFLGVITATAVLSGALMVGDSIHYTLQSTVQDRLGKTSYAVIAGNRFFRDAWATDLEQALQTNTAPVLMLNGSVSVSDGSARVNRAQVMGVDGRFWKLAHSGVTPLLPPEGVALNRQAASRLNVKVGSEVILRVGKPSVLPRDAPLSTAEDLTVAIRATVTTILADESLGPFSLQADQVSPPNAFLFLNWLQEKVDLAGQANLALIAKTTPQDLSSGDISKVLHETWQLADAGLDLRMLPAQGMAELSTSRIFLDPPAVDAALQVVPASRKVLSYFANELRVGERSCPYSIVTALDGPEGQLESDGILINEWLAEDLQARVGDSLEMAYFVTGPMRKLIERRRSFIIRQIVPISGKWADPDLMPAFPGLSGAENCRDWDPGFSVDVQKIRDKDEAYWDQYKGTPKAFVSLAIGQEMWSNRFGNLTAIRFTADETTLATIGKGILGNLDPSRAGLSIRPVQEEGQRASSQAMDFGGLFLSLSFFLITAALILVGLLYVLGVEQRAEETGLLLALGFPAWRVRRFLLSEGICLAALGGLLGTFLGLVYTYVVVQALSTVWNGAVGGNSRILFNCSPGTLVKGAVAGVLMALLAIILTLRKHFRQPARALLSGIAGPIPMGSSPPLQRPTSLWVGVGGLLLAAALLLVGGARTSPALFFVIGALCLVSGLGLTHAWLVGLANRTGRHRLTLWTLSAGNASRRRGRSTAVVGLLACGTFLVISVGANRYDTLAGAKERASGTGGFALFGETTLPVLQDLNSEEGCNAYGLSRQDLPGVSFVPMRVRQGDDASCLNLNRPQTPNLLGVDPAPLAERNAFSFAGHVDAKDSSSPWLLLDEEGGDEIIPAIADQATLQWAIQKRLGDTLTYTSETGHPFQVRFEAALAGSILQGNILIPERAFTRLFPSESGYRQFLIDVPADKADSLIPLMETLSKALETVGLDVIPTVNRLAAFHAVENTYLSIFQALGALGLMLGSIGLGVVVLRNVLECRAELALLRAVGFPAGQVHQLVRMEHWLLLAVGLFLGAFSGLVAVFPHLLTGQQAFPWLSLSVTVLALFLNGLLWIWGATLLALRGPLLSSLRNE